MLDIKELIAEARDEASSLKDADEGMIYLNKGDLTGTANLIESLCDELAKKQKKTEIVIDEKTKLVAECYDPDDPNGYREISVGIEKDGVFYQDLALVKRSHSDLDGDGFANIPGKYDVYVWGDCSSEDYTEKFEINEFNEEQ